MPISPEKTESKRILAPVTMSGAGEVKVPVLAEQARAFDADVILLHVLDGRLSSPAGDVSLEEALRSFDDDVRRCGAASPHFLGPRTVHLTRIVGTVTRVADLGRDFRPLRKRPDEEQRHRQVLKTMDQRAEQMPPVELYKLGYGYYVFSGHAQVAAAKQLEQQWIEAMVTEYVPRANLDAQRALDERSAFECTTGLHGIGAARAGNYPRLQSLINGFARHHEIADRQEAARRWYATIFQPAQRLMREQHLAQYFPGERSADVLLRVACWMERQPPADGRLPTWQEAIRALAADLRQGQHGNVTRAA